MAYVVYILKCIDQTLYTGITTDLEKRFHAHQQGAGAAYTRAHKPERIVYTETKRTRGSALKREYALKQLTRTEKQALIARFGETPTSRSKAPRRQRRPRKAGPARQA